MKFITQFLNSPHRRKIQFVCLLGLVGLAASGIIWMYKHAEALYAFLQHPDLIPPWVFVLAIGLLPAFGCPATLLYGLVALAYTQMTDVILVLLGLSLNLVIVYIVSRKFFKDYILGFLKRKGRSIPEVSSKNQWKLAFLIRLMLFIPFSIQNYLLSLTEMSFLAYFLPALLIQGAYGISIVLFTDNFIAKFPYKLEATIVAAIGVGGYLLYKFLRRPKSPQPLPSQATVDLKRKGCSS